MAGMGKLSGNRIKALLSLNEERGIDSVGVAYRTGDGVKVEKVAERPCVAVNLTLSKAITEAAVSGLMIGHTRQATQGGVSARNAHPFMDDGVAFAHNGVIVNDHDFGKYEVDSESLIHGIKARDFSKYEGPIALVWIEDGKLKAYRCGNPLYRGRYHESVYLASDKDYLKDVGCTHVKEIAEGMIYTFVTPSTVMTERVGKNKTFTSTGKAKGCYGNTQTWEEYLDERWGRKTTMTEGTILIPSEAKTIQSFTEEKEDRIAQEDFRTPADIARTMTGEGKVDNCLCCGDIQEISEDGYCQGCATWLDHEGIDRDNPPAWLRVV